LEQSGQRPFEREKKLKIFFGFNSITVNDNTGLVFKFYIKNENLKKNEP
jgi:hypothetical protein